MSPQGQPCSLVFQALAWHAEDVDYSDPQHGGDGGGPDEPDDMRFTLKVFGRCSAGKTVSATITGFTPFFYVEVQQEWTKRQLEKFGEFLRNKLPSRMRPSMLPVRSIHAKPFYGFRNGETSQFVRLTFRSLKAMRWVLRVLSAPLHVPTLTQRATAFKLYESNVDSTIRFMHLRDLQPCGWINLPAGKFRTSTCVLQSNSQQDVEVGWQDVHPHACDDTAAFTVAAFDIECTSSSGEFPVAKKEGYRHLAGQLADLYTSLTKGEGADEHKVKTVVQDALLWGLGASPEERRVEGIHRNDTKTPADPAQLAATAARFVDDIYSILTGKFAGGKVNRDKIVTTLSTLLSSDAMRLPRLRGDSIIQIGTTVHAYGQRECSYKHIITLGTCAPVEGAVVESCETEEELLLKWRDLIVKLDPDMVTGYNIVGFDMAYMYDRATELNIASAFMKLGRFQDRVSLFKENKLSSSALGDNVLRYVDMEGRVLVDLMKVVQRDHRLDSYKLDLVAHHFIGLNKNDVSPQEIFALQRGSAEDRARIAAYCIQDCQLCNLLAIKLEIVANNMGMANVCLVPLSFIFMRGQGVKIFSLVLKQAREEGFLMPLVRPPPDAKPGEEPDPAAAAAEEEGYEGAIVLEPQTGIYVNEPVSVLDYASLYPSSMISENLSHDCLVTDPKYDNLPGVEYLDISFDVYEGGVKQPEPKTCRFAQLADGKKGVIPNILMKLLKARKTTRKRATLQQARLLSTGEAVRGFWEDDAEQVFVSEDGAARWPRDQLADGDGDGGPASDAFTPFQQAVLDGLQLAYKVTANSLYGQIGARTSPIYLKDIAACTTATGRKMIMMAKTFLEEECGARVVYGDTDSVFCVMPREEGVKGHAAIAPSIQKAIDASSIFKKRIKKPHDLEYEKTFWPFILLSKKRYVGNKYEHDDANFKQNSMGIVLKRRDNANIVKKVYGGIIDSILNRQDVPGSVDFLKRSLQDLVDGRCDMDDLVVTKALRSDYKDPDRIAHKVLADRMAERDPGNKPQSSDRIPYVYIKAPPPGKGEAKLLQGERIETPSFIRANNLAIDYNHYITNQIMKPVLQLYAIVVEQLPGFYQLHNKPADYWDIVRRNIEQQPELAGDPKKVAEKLATVREANVKELLFDPYLRQVAEGGKVSKSMLMRKFAPPPVPTAEELAAAEAAAAEKKAAAAAAAAEKRAAAAAARAAAKKAAAAAEAAAAAAATTDGGEAAATSAKPPPKPRAPRKPKAAAVPAAEAAAGGPSQPPEPAAAAGGGLKQTKLKVTRAPKKKAAAETDEVAPKPKALDLTRDINAPPPVIESTWRI